MEDSLVREFRFVGEDLQDFHIRSNGRARVEAILQNDVWIVLKIASGFKVKSGSHMRKRKHSLCTCKPGLTNIFFCILIG